MNDSGPSPAVVLEYMKERVDEMSSLLERLAGTESPSSDVASQRDVRDMLADSLDQVGLTTERIRGHEVGDHLRAERARRVEGAPTQLLLGHLDTVWPIGTLDTMPVERTDDRLAGPGTFDMKAGLVQMIFALGAVERLGLPMSVEPVVLINSDEEIGSPESGALIAQLAADAVRAFVLEGSFGSAGDLKTGRKGVGRFSLIVTGVAAHAGLDPGMGTSAVLEIAAQIQRVFELNDPERGVTLNVGTVDGGLRPNVVAPEARAEIDCRVPTHEDARRVEESLRALQPTQEGIRLAVTGGFGRPPMEPTERNRELWETARQAAESLGLGVGEAFVGGGSDGNITSQYTATLDGLGAVGAGAHAPHEHVVVSKMPERAALLTLLLTAPAPAGDGGAS